MKKLGIAVISALLLSGGLMISTASNAYHSHGGGYYGHGYYGHGNYGHGYYGRGWGWSGTGLVVGIPAAIGAYGYANCGRYRVCNGYQCWYQSNCY